MYLVLRVYVDLQLYGVVLGGGGGLDNLNLFILMKKKGDGVVRCVKCLQYDG